MHLIDLVNKHTKNGIFCFPLFCSDHCYQRSFLFVYCNFPTEHSICCGFFIFTFCFCFFQFLLLVLLLLHLTLPTKNNHSKALLIRLLLRGAWFPHFVQSKYLNVFGWLQINLTSKTVRELNENGSDLITRIVTFPLICVYICDDVFKYNAIKCVVHVHDYGILFSFFITSSFSVIAIVSTHKLVDKTIFRFFVHRFGIHCIRWWLYNYRSKMNCI